MVYGLGYSFNRKQQGVDISMTYMKWGILKKMPNSPYSTFLALLLLPE